MKSYIQFLNERLNPNFRGMVIDGIPVKFTSHSLERHGERTHVLSQSDWEIILNRVVKDIKLKLSGYYLYFSKSYNQGVVLFWDKKNIFIVTILPKGNKFAKSDTKLAIIESCVLNKFPQRFDNILLWVEIE